MSSPDVLLQVTHSLSSALTPSPSSLHSPHSVPEDNIVKTHFKEIKIIS